jgi:hypothetical protein
VAIVKQMELLASPTVDEVRCVFSKSFITTDILGSRYW